MDTNPDPKPDIREMAEKLDGTIAKLTAVLNEEIEGVYTRKTSDLTRLYQEKTNLLADYAASVSAMRTLGGKDGIELPAPLSASLKEKSSLLMQAMERNIKALQVAHEASRQVVEVIVDAVKKQRQSGAAYGRDHKGELVVNEGGESAAAAVTLDTRL